MRNFGGILLVAGILGFFYASSRIQELGPLPAGLSVSEGLKEPAGRWEMGRYACVAVAGFGLLMALFPQGALSAVLRVCVFCGSSPGRDPRYAEAATALARGLVSRGIGIVFGGGSVGLMGVLADQALAAGGSVVGVIPHGLAARELAHHGVADMRVVATMHERKALMAELADGFVALPGGTGTLEELFEAVTWGQLGIHRKPIGVLNVAGYYDPLVALLDQAVTEGFVSASNRGALHVDDQPLRLLDRMASHLHPPTPAWITPEGA